MWPFGGRQQAITVDDMAKILSDEIRTGMNLYLEVMDHLVVINNNLHELKDFVEEIWIYQIALFNYTCSVINFSESLKNKVLVMLVGYSNVDYKHYIERSQNYGEALTHVNAELVPLTVSNVLAEIIDTEYSGYKTSNGRVLLTESFSAFSFKTMKKLGNKTLELQRNYKILD